MTTFDIDDLSPALVLLMSRVERGEQVTVVRDEHAVAALVPFNGSPITSHTRIAENFDLVAD